ncbi:MAG: hypothetical protein ACJAZ9_001024 [Neolewinella sp.]|jgi:hypothetical protein
MTEGNGYVHFTQNDNIVITTLNKRSGLAVMLETRDVDGTLLPASRWLITKTQNEQQLKQALVFRSQDIKDFFKADGYETTYRTERYLDVQQKITIARTNIGEELTRVAEEEDILLVGQRLQSTINNIVRPSERRVRGLVEDTRSKQIIEEARGFRKQLANLTDPSAYRDILNSVRAASDELAGMATGDVTDVVSEFKAIRRELNHTFSRQIADDGNNLQTFITKEIEQIELAIDNTHEARQLENLLSTHPAAVELMSLLKHLEGCLRHLREQFYSSAGQTEIEGTNREFINAVYLMGMVGS